MGPSSILFGSVYRCVCTFQPGNFTGCGSDPVVHVRVRLTMETPKLPACTKSVSLQNVEVGHYTEEEDENICSISIRFRACLRLCFVSTLTGYQRGNISRQLLL